MTTEEKLMTLQTLGKLLEAQYTFVKTELDGTPMPPPYPKSILDSGDRLVVQAKITEFVKSLRPDEMTKAITKELVKEDWIAQNNIVTKKD